MYFFNVQLISSVFSNTYSIYVFLYINENLNGVPLFLFITPDKTSDSLFLCLNKIFDLINPEAFVMVDREGSENDALDQANLKKLHCKVCLLSINQSVYFLYNFILQTIFTIIKMF